MVTCFSSLRLLTITDSQVKYKYDAVDIFVAFRFARKLELKPEAAAPARAAVAASPRRSERISAATNHRSRSPSPGERRTLRKRKVSNNSTADEEASPSKRSAARHYPSKRRSGADDCVDNGFPTSSSTPNRLVFEGIFAFIFSTSFVPAIKRNICSIFSSSFVFQWAISLSPRGYVYFVIFNPP